MKITILALHLGFGGIEKFISNIANMFCEKNEVEIISVYKLYDKPSFYINPKVKITYLLGKLKPNREEFYYALKHFKIIDVIKQGFISVKILYLKKSKMKSSIKKNKSDVIISTIAPHNTLVSKYARNCIKIATEHNYKAFDTKYINKVVNSCKNLDYLVVASNKLSELYTSKLSYEKCKIVNIPLSLDYIPKTLSKLDSKEITYIGRLSEEKGVVDLIDVFKKVNDKDKTVILNIVGDGYKKQEVISKINDYNLQKNVIIHGFKYRNEIEKVLLNTSLGINTSYTESFGLSILETFSFGIPCVAFSTAEGLKEIIENNKNGYIIDNRNFEEMAEKIIELMNNKEKRIEFGKNAREKSLSFTDCKLKEKWEELFQTKAFN